MNGNGGASFSAWARRHLGAIVTVASGAAAAIGLVTGSRIEWGGARLAKLETKVADLDTRTVTLEKVFTREMRYLVAMQCSSADLPDQIWFSIECPQRLNDLGVSSPRRPR